MVERMKGGRKGVMEIEREGIGRKGMREHRKHAREAQTG